MRKQRPDFRVWEGKKAALFDLDGTLMDSMWIWDRIDIEYLASFGKTISRAELLRLQKKIEGMSMAETAEVFRDAYGIPDPPELMQKSWNEMAYEKYARDVRLKEGARDLLFQMQQQGLKLGVVTSNTELLTRAALEGNGMLQDFDLIRSAQSVPRGKPAPDVYLAAASDLGVSPGDCIVFEDVPNGAGSGKNAGMEVCGVEDQFAKDRREELYRLVDFYIRSFVEILRP